MKKKIIVIQGPTASGKTALGVELAKYYDTVVVSSDSRQFYKEMSIGTAKPSKEEMSNIPHFFIDSHSINQELTAASYEKEALTKLTELFKEKDVVLLVGGSGMYIDALCEGLDDIPASKEIKKQLNKELKENGLQVLLSELKQKDLEYYETVDKSNPMRVIRALEAIRFSGKTYSSFRNKKKIERSFKVVRFVINHERTVLYDRINQRVDQMINDGLVDEVKSLERYRELAVMKTVGYSEFFDFFDNKLTLDEAIEKVKQNTRRYAKRQLTWFRRKESAVWLKYTDIEGMKKEVIAVISAL